MSEFMEVWKYYFNTRYITSKGKRKYFTRGICIAFGFTFYLVIPIFILSSPFIYFKTRKKLKNENNKRTKTTNN